MSISFQIIIRKKNKKKHCNVYEFVKFGATCSRAFLNKLCTVKKKLQRILQCFTVKLLQRTTVSAIYSELLLFFTFIFVKCCVFYSVKCKMLRYIVRNIVIFLTVKYGHPFCPPKTVNFVFFTVNL